MENMIIPKRYSLGYDLDGYYLDDLDEEIKLILNICYKEENTDYNKLLKLLERYYKDDYYELKLKINQPGVFFLLYAYIQLRMYDKAKELYFKIYDTKDVNHRAIIINIAIEFNTGHEEDAKKLTGFIDYLLENEEDEIKSFYFSMIAPLSVGAIGIFAKVLVNMANEFGITEETIPIYTELKDLCKRANVLKEVRAIIREVRDTEQLDVFKELYRIM